jgi:hypothetical protein
VDSRGAGQLQTMHESGRGWGGYLDGLKWDHVATLTTRHPKSERRLLECLRWGFVRRLERIAQRRIDWFCRLETTNSGGHLHVHALLSGTSGISCREIQRHWRQGHSRVTVFRAGGGAGDYVTKGLDLSPDSYWISRRLPPAVLPSESHGISVKARRF